MRKLGESNSQSGLPHGGMCDFACSVEMIDPLAKFQDAELGSLFARVESGRCCKGGIFDEASCSCPSLNLNLENE